MFVFFFGIGFVVRLILKLLEEEIKVLRVVFIRRIIRVVVF